jgi:RNA polymerase sigma-70 factor (ECF subfamily)
VRHSPQPSGDSATRLSLLDEARAGDPAAWDRLVDLYGPLVLRWCRSLGLPREAAEDACQETFAAVAKSLASFRMADGPGSFRGWLLAIARNKARDQSRRSRRQPPAAGGSEARELIDAAPAPDLDAEDSAESDRTEVVRRALAMIRRDFDDSTWQAFWAAAVDERPSAEVGTEFGLTANAVRKSKARVLRRLREEFDGLLPGL